MTADTDLFFNCSVIEARRCMRLRQKMSSVSGPDSIDSVRLLSSRYDSMARHQSSNKFKLRITSSGSFAAACPRVSTRSSGFFSSIPPVKLRMLSSNPFENRSMLWTNSCCCSGFVSPHASSSMVWIIGRYTHRMSTSKDFSGARMIPKDMVVSTLVGSISFGESSSE